LLPANKYPSADVLKRAFGICVCELRKRVGLSQDRLALIAHLDRGNMGGLERGEDMPTLDTIYRLLPALGVSFSEFALEFEKALRRETRNRSTPK
jgi:transcriptional regulator with XRE-family HTH domain